MTEQLKPLPCPFCGGENTKTHVYEGEAPDAFVQCHDCTSTGSSGEGDAGAIEAWNRRAQPAQAVPLLTEQEIVKCLTASGCVGTIKMSYDSGPYEITRTSINADRFARRIEQAVRAKMGVAVPMTDEQADDILLSCMPLTNPHRLIRTAENFHGIVGKEGA